MTEGNINYQRDQKGVIANDGSKVEIKELHQHFDNTNPYKPGIPFQVPPVPQHFVPRPLYADRVRNHLLCEDADQPGTLVVSAIHGLGGIGKSVLAAAIAHEQEIRDRFPDGILWITLGQTPDLLVALGDWIRSLGDRDYKPTTVAAASSYLRSLLVDKTMLLVVDDLWDAAHFKPFQVTGQRCYTIVTAREEGLLGEIRSKEAGVKVWSQRLEGLSVQEGSMLVAQRRSQTLLESEREECEAFATAVGYLPSVLEMGAAEVEAGSDWLTLLSDLSDKLGPLEFDDYGEVSTWVRRRQSVQAQFYMSFWQLHRLQRWRLAWLGVFPEGISVTARIIAPLWQVSVSEAQEALTDFVRRMLLYLGEPVAVGDQFELAFQLPDFARTNFAPSPSATFPELEQSVKETHRLFLRRYRPLSGQWWDLDEDGYIYHHLTWHMEQAGQITEIYGLIQASNGNGKNAWQERCEQLGLLGLFEKDVERAWRCAEEIYGIIPRTAEGWRLQFWCAFAMGSLNSLEGRMIPGEVLAAAVRQGHWSEARALAHALKNSKKGDREAELAHKKSCEAQQKAYELQQLRKQDREKAKQKVAESQRSQAIRDRYSKEHEKAIAQREQAKRNRAEALEKMMGVLESPHIVTKAIQAIPAIQDIRTVWCREQVLDAAIAHQQPYWSTEKGLNTVRQLRDRSIRNPLLVAIAQQQPQIYCEALLAQRHPRDASQIRPWIALTEMLPQALDAGLAPESLDEALTQVCQIPDAFGTGRAWVDHGRMESAEAILFTLPWLRPGDDPATLARILTPLIEQQPGLSSEVTQTIHQVTDGIVHARALALTHPNGALSPETRNEIRKIGDQLSSGFDRLKSLIASAQPKVRLLVEIREMIKQTRGTFGRAKLLTALVQQQPNLHGEALEETRQITDHFNRAQVLTTLAQQQTKPNLDLYREALTTARQITDASNQACALTALAKTLPSELQSEVLATIRQIADGGDRVVALVALGDHSQELREEALVVARQISDPYQQSRALAALSYWQPELCGAAIEVVRQIGDAPFQALALRELAKQQGESPDQFLHEAIDITHYVADASERAWAFGELVKQQPELLNEALEAIRQVPDRGQRNFALIQLIRKLPPEFGSQALDAVSEISDISKRSPALIELSDKLPSELLRQGLEIVRQLPDDTLQSQALIKLSDKLPLEYLDEALNIIRQTPYNLHRVRVLVALGKRRPEVYGEAIETIRQISHQSNQSRALVELAGVLPLALHNEVLEIVRRLPSESYRAWALLELGEKQPQLYREALVVTRQNGDKPFRAWTLTVLSTKLPSEQSELLAEALQVVGQIPNKSQRLEVLIALVEHQGDLLAEALEAIFQAFPSSKPKRDRALGKLAEKLSIERCDQALEVVRQISDGGDRDRALMKLVETLPPERYIEALQATRQIVSDSHRDQTLVKVAAKQPMLLEIALKVVRQMHYEADRVWALKKLAHILPVELLGEALEVANALSFEPDRVSALEVLAESLPAAISQDRQQMATTIEHLRSFQDPFYRAQALSSFANTVTWQAIARDHHENLLRLLSTRERKHLIELLPKLYPTLLELGGQPAVDAALDAMRDACNQWP